MFLYAMNLFDLPVSKVKLIIGYNFIGNSLVVRSQRDDGKMTKKNHLKYDIIIIRDLKKCNEHFFTVIVVVKIINQSLTAGQIPNEMKIEVKNGNHRMIQNSRFITLDRMLGNILEKKPAAKNLNNYLMQSVKISVDKSTTTLLTDFVNTVNGFVVGTGQQ